MDGNRHTAAKGKTVRNSTRYIIIALELARQLIMLADDAEAEAEDDSCVVLCGVIRDSAYKIRNLAERERDVHIERGSWDAMSLPEKNRRDGENAVRGNEDAGTA